MSTVVVGNRRSPEVLGALQAASRTNVAELVAHDGPSTRRAVAEAVAGGAERVVVIGGDGIVHDVVQELAGTEVVLGVVAHGTGNDFARALGLPLDDPVAGARAAMAEPVSVDLIRSEHGWATTVVCAGFPAQVNERANRMRFPRGSSKYTVATFLLLPRLRDESVRLEIDTGSGVEIVDGPVNMLGAANTAFFGGGMKICPDADPADGMIDLAVVQPLSRVQLLRFLPSVFSGAHRSNQRVRFWRARSITVEGDITLWADGEPYGPAPATLTTVRGALRVAGVVGVAR